MNRREFLTGAAALTAAMVGHRERYLVKTLGVPRGEKWGKVAVHVTGCGYDRQMEYLLKNPGMALAV